MWNLNKKNSEYDFKNNDGPLTRTYYKEFPDGGTECATKLCVREIITYFLLCQLLWACT